MTKFLGNSTYKVSLKTTSDEWWVREVLSYEN